MYSVISYTLPDTMTQQEVLELCFATSWGLNMAFVCL